MKYFNPFMLLRIAQGDSFGLAAEYLKPKDHYIITELLRFNRYLKHPSYHLTSGFYSDDTQMSVGVSEVLLENDSSVLTEQIFADKFVQCFKRDPRDSYSRGFQALLEEVSDGTEFLAKVHRDSDKNGAAMRSVPIGVLSDPAEVKRVARLQAKITHNTPGGIQSSILVALMSHFALHVDQPMYKLRPWLENQVGESIPIWSGARVTAPNVGMATARAVMSLVTEQGNLLSIARDALEWGGDTDSVLSIAWGIASTRYHTPLPEFFDRDLEPGSKYGRNYLLSLGMALMKKYG